jgi:uncharacterized protein (DUF1778 family)
MSPVQSAKSSRVKRRLHTVARIARENDTSDGFVHKLIREGVLEAVRIRGRMIRVTDESYQRFLASLERAPKSAA